jgi:ribonuclease HI
MNMDKIIVVVCDASVIGSVKGPTGWAAWVDGELFSGYAPVIMGNNAAELLAILQGIIRCPVRSRVLVWSDSKWALRWMKGKPIYTRDIREIRLAIHDAIDALDLLVTWQLIKGHRTNDLHNLVDREARRQAKIAYEVIYER